MPPTRRYWKKLFQELKENEFKELFKEDLEKKRDYVREVQIETDVEMLIPDEYVSNIQERLSLYTKLDGLEREEELDAFEKELRDRFGKIPPQVKELFQGLKLRWVCRELGFDRLILKSNKLRCYFVENAQSPYYESKRFGNIVGLVSKEGKQLGLSLKQSHNRLILIRDGVKSLSQANHLLGELLKRV